MIKESQIYKAFRFGVFLKGIHAVIEIASGLILAFVSTDTIVNFVASMTQDEIREDPKDVVANFLFQSAQHLANGGREFAAWYLLSHGVINMFMVVGLLKRKLWAYPLTLVVMGLFVAYQMYRFTFTRSPWLVILSIFDLCIMVLTLHEYRVMRRAFSSTENRA